MLYVCSDSCLWGGKRSACKCFFILDCFSIWKKKFCSSRVLDNRQTWFIWGKKVVLRFFSVNLESYGRRLKPVSTEFLKLWVLCKIYSLQAKKERTPPVTPILLKQTVTTIMCNLSASLSCLLLIYSNPVQHFTLSNEAETRKQKLGLSKHFCLSCSGFFLFLF